MPVVATNELKRDHVVSRGVVTSLGLAYCGVGALDLVDTEVEEPKLEDRDDAERNTVRELGNALGVRRRRTARVEDDQAEQEDDLVENLWKEAGEESDPNEARSKSKEPHLSPSLHKESQHDVPAPVHPVVPSSSRSVRAALEGAGGRHGVLSTDTDTVDEERPGVADNPSVEGGSPDGGQEQYTDEHDKRVLNETKFACESKDVRRSSCSCSAKEVTHVRSSLPQSRQRPGQR